MYNNFSKEKNNVTIKKIIILIIILVIIIPLVILTLSTLKIRSDYYKNKENQQVKIPYANQNIYEGTMITADKVSYKLIKMSELKKIGNYINDIDDIIGKCPKENITIKEDNLFYYTELAECPKINDDYES